MTIKMKNFKKLINYVLFIILACIVCVGCDSVKNKERREFLGKEKIILVDSNGGIWFAIHNLGHDYDLEFVMDSAEWNTLKQKK